MEQPNQKQPTLGPDVRPEEPPCTSPPFEGGLKAANSLSLSQGDHLTLLNVFDAWKRNEMAVEWSQQNFVQQKELERALDIRNQLLNIMESHGVPVVSCWGR